MTRGVIITKLTIKATNNCPERYHFVNILLIFTFISEFKVSGTGSHKNDNVAVVYCRARKNVKTVLAEF